MEHWKRALVAGSAGAAIAMFAKGKHPVALLFAGISLATLASEYPEKFAEIRRKLPRYVEQGTDLMEVAGRLGERLAEAAEGRASNWYEALLSR